MNHEGLAIIGPIGARKFTLEKKCELNEGHQHNYDHVTIVIRGRVLVKYSYEDAGQKIEGESREFEAGEIITIKANVSHTIKALEDNSQYLCVFSHRDFDGLVTQKYAGNERSYT